VSDRQWACWGVFSLLVACSDPARTTPTATVAASAIASTSTSLAAPADMTAPRASASSAESAPSAASSTPTASTNDCGEFARKFESAGTFVGSHVELFVPKSKDGLPQALQWRACPTNEGMAPPTDCREMRPDAMSLNGLKLSYGLDGSPRFLATGRYHKPVGWCDLLATIEPSGAIVSGAALRGIVSAHRLTAGEGLVVLGGSVANQFEVEGARRWTISLLAFGTATPPTLEVQDLGRSEEVGCMPLAIGAKAWVGKDCGQNFGALRRVAVSTTAAAIVGDTFVGVVDGTLQAIDPAGVKTMLHASTQPIQAVRANRHWIVWVEQQGESSAIYAAPFSNTGELHLVELAVVPRRSLHLESLALGPKHLTTGDTLFRLADGARWSSPAWATNHVLGATDDEVYFETQFPLGVRRVPLSSLGEPTPMPR